MHPNPGNPATALTFSLASPGAISLQVFDATGRRVAQVDQRRLSAGRHTITWNGKDRDGRAVASGVYWIRLQTGAGARVQKVIVLK